MGKRTAATLITIVLAAPVGVALTSTTAEAAAKSYSSCAKLHKDCKHGVATSKRAANKQVNQAYGLPAYGTKAKAVYWKNHNNLDRDDDGTACEA
jgi:hypothetical protein